MMREKNLPPQRCPLSLWILLYIMANTPIIHCIIFDRLALPNGLMMRWK